MQTGERHVGPRLRWLSFAVALACACGCSSGARSPGVIHLAETLAAADAQVAQRVSASTSRLGDDARGGAVSPGWDAKGSIVSGLALGAHLPRDASDVFAMGLATRAEIETPGEMRGDYVLRVKHDAMAGAPLALDHGRAIYAGIARDADLVFTATEERVEWFYVLKSERAPRSFVLDVSLPRGLSVRSEAGGSLAFDDAHGRARLRMPRPFVLDARGQRRDASLAWDGEHTRVTVALDSTGLTYPLLLDPALEHDVWLQVGSATPSARRLHAMAYDNHRGKTVLFGGLGSAGSVNDTWEWDGSVWAQMTTTVSPPAEYGTAMAFDSARNVTVLFGGSANGADTWEWNGTTWTQRTVTTAPPARSFHAMTYDAARNVTVLFGGTANGGNTALADTWEWNGTTWTQGATSTVPARSRHVMTYDTTRQKTVLFGGSDATGTAYLSDTWESNGTSWAQSTTNTVPPGRDFAVMAFDSVDGKSLLFGGLTSSGLVNDTWEWDGTTWTLLGQGPLPANYGAAMAFDTARGKATLFGGDLSSSGFAPIATTWEWNSSRWTERNVATAPATRFNASIAYDNRRGVTVLFGGDAVGGAYFGDTWEWDGLTWTQRFGASGVSPSARVGAAMAFDSTHGFAVLFGGGGGNDTWTWDGTSWVQRTVTGPPAQSGPVMSYDSARQMTVLFNGSDPGNTWEWDGVSSSWTQHAVAGPSARSSESMAYDSTRGVTLLFGGYGPGHGINNLNDLWSWNGTSWSLLSPASSPPVTNAAPMAFDGARSRLVLIDSGTWAWDGTTWTQLTVTTPGVTAASMTFDSARGRSVLVNEGTTWEFHSYGDACTSALQCDTGFCVDGVCCQTFACGTCQQCALSGSEGTCSFVAQGGEDPDTCTSPNSCSGAGLCGVAQGSTCTRNGDCQSGFCVDAVCCDTACSGDCQVCAASKGAAANGFCAIAPLGAAPRTNDCGIYACSGASPSCTTQCTSDLGCTAGYYCASNGACTVQKSQGSTCSPSAGQDCLASDCRECAPIGSATSGQCVDGVCCDTPCEGACDACNVSGSLGTCRDVTAGSVGAPSCAPNLCTGSNASCGTTCASNTDCAAQAYCDPASHQCKGTAVLGTPCTNDGACTSGACVTGVCCQAKCGTSSSDGGVSSCEVGICNATTGFACELPAGSECRMASCTDGVQTFVSVCDGKGGCGDLQTRTCAPYACDATECKTSCSVSSDCAAGATCNTVKSQCENGATCSSDGTSVVSNSGQPTSCAPYVCAGDACKTTCGSVTDCATGFVCSAAGACVASSAAPTPTSNSGCGCRVGTSPRTGGATMLTLGGLVLAVRRRRRRERAI